MLWLKLCSNSGFLLSLFFDKKYTKLNYSSNDNFKNLILWYFWIQNLADSLNKTIKMLLVFELLPNKMFLVLFFPYVFSVNYIINMNLKGFKRKSFRLYRNTDFGCRFEKNQSLLGPLHDTERQNNRPK